MGDERPVTLQEFLDRACDAWGLARPWRMPFGLIQAAAVASELISACLGCPAPLTRDFLAIGRVPYWGDTSRARAELVPRLFCPTLDQGLALL